MYKIKYTIISLLFSLPFLTNLFDEKFWKNTKAYLSIYSSRMACDPILTIKHQTQISLGNMISIDIKLITLLDLVFILSAI